MLSTTFAMMGLGPTELIVVGIVMVLLFGHKLPEVMRGFGRGYTEFHKEIRDVKSQVQEVRS